MSKNLPRTGKKDRPKTAVKVPPSDYPRHLPSEFHGRAAGDWQSHHPAHSAFRKATDSSSAARAAGSMGLTR
jgi:hypothetical protein